MKYKKFLLTLIIICNWAIAISQEKPDSLISYLTIAAKNNPTVLQRYYEYEAALQKVPQVGSLPDPELNVGVFLSPMEVMSGYQVADIRFMQMFPWFGVLKNAKDEMSLMAKAKFESFRDAKLQLFYDVQRSWYELYKNQENIRISKDNIEILNTLERLSLIKFKAVSTGTNPSSSVKNLPNNNLQNTSSASSGMQSMGGNSSANSNQSVPAMQTNTMSSSSGGSGLADIYRIQIEISELNNNIELLKTQQITLIAKFNSFLNRPATMTISISDSLEPDKSNIAFLAVSDSTTSNNPMLWMLKYEQQSLEAKKKMVTAMSYPMIGLGVNYTLINKNEMSTSVMNGQDMIMPMITVTLPIYRKKYKAMRREVDLLNSATQQNYNATSNSLQSEYYAALQLHQDAQRRMKLYENQSFLANKTLDILIKSFSTSGSDLTDILQIRQQLFNYEFKQVEALTDYKTSIAWLKRLMANVQIN